KFDADATRFLDAERASANSRLQDEKPDRRRRPTQRHSDVARKPVQADRRPHAQSASSVDGKSDPSECRQSLSEHGQQSQAADSQVDEKLRSFQSVRRYLPESAVDGTQEAQRAVHTGSLRPREGGFGSDRPRGRGTRVRTEPQPTPL